MPLFVATALTALRGRVPFVLRALVTVASAGFGLMIIIVRLDLPRAVAQTYPQYGPGFALAATGANLACCLLLPRFAACDTAEAVRCSGSP